MFFKGSFIKRKLVEVFLLGAFNSGPLHPNYIGSSRRYIKRNILMVVREYYVAVTKYFIVSFPFHGSPESLLNFTIVPFLKTGCLLSLCPFHCSSFFPWASNPASMETWQFGIELEYYSFFFIKLRWYEENFIDNNKMSYIWSWRI